MNKEFDQHIKASKYQMNMTRKRVNQIRLIEEFINHYEFLVLEEIKIEKRKNGNYERWQKLLSV